MEELHLTQEEVAAMAQRSQPSVARWLKGGSEPDTLHASLLASKLGVQWRWLLHGEGARNLGQADGVDGGSALAHLRQEMTRANYTPQSLAKKIGYAPGTVRDVVEGRARASETMIARICEAIPTLSKEELMEGSDSPTMFSETGAGSTIGLRSTIDVPPGRRQRNVPIISQAQAGNYHVGYTDEGYAFEGQPVIDVEDRKAFAVVIEGDSMSTRINPGDMVIVAPSVEPRAGDIVLVKTTAGDVFCKLLQRSTSERIYLASINPAHAPFDLPKKEVEWIYFVHQIIGFTRRA